MKNELKVVLTFLVSITLALPVLAQQENNREEPGFGDDPRVSKGPIAPLLPGLGTHSMKVSTKSESAQRFFDQGLSLAYAYNHDEAKRAFQESVRLDPKLAMGYWGWALVLGPNLNRPMTEGQVEEAFTAMQKAVELKGTASSVEQALIDALATRYSKKHEDRAQLDAAYNSAMKVLYQKFPNDPDVGTLYGASVMNLMPWSYWSKDKTPMPQTRQAMAVFESVWWC